jgi:hypothetical protein
MGLGVDADYACDRTKRIDPFNPSIQFVPACELHGKAGALERCHAMPRNGRNAHHRGAPQMPVGGHCTNMKEVGKKWEKYKTPGLQK